MRTLSHNLPTELLWVATPVDDPPVVAGWLVHTFLDTALFLPTCKSISSPFFLESLVRYGLKYTTLVSILAIERRNHILVTIYSCQHFANFTRISLRIFSKNITAFCRLNLNSACTIIDSILLITLGYYYNRDYGITHQEFDNILST